MASILAYYWFEETGIDGKANKQTRIEPTDIKKFLSQYAMDSDIDFALAVTADNPGVPYDLYRADDAGRFLWTARITLQVKYIH